ncbi:MAG: response regulator transcription factor [Brumimicrobium sp.]
MNNLKKILLVEDEGNLNEIIELNLKMEGYEVTSIADGKEAIEFAPNLHNYDLVILDVMLPEVSGWDICKIYKEESPSTLILFMSAKGTSSDKIKGLKLGADDYLGKPFDLEELLLRVKILINRKEKTSIQNETLKLGDSKVNTLTFEVERENGGKIELSKREIELIQLFFEHEGEVVPRDFILKELWSDDKSTPTSRTIDNYILAFRKIFEKDPKNPKLFQSIRGVGYKFVNH